MYYCFVYPHKIFDSYMAKSKWNDDHVPQNAAIISICCQPEIKKKYLEEHKHETDEHWFKKNHSNVLNIEFDDITEEKHVTEKYGTAYGMSDADASKIIEFIEENKDKEFWILHCRSGKSRSVATGMFIQKYFKEKHGIDVELEAKAAGTKEYNKYMFKKFCKIAGLKDEYVEV